MNKKAQFERNINPPIISPTNVPIMHNTPDIALNTSARCNDTPARRSTAKSPICELKVFLKYRKFNIRVQSVFFK